MPCLGLLRLDLGFCQGHRNYFILDDFQMIWGEQLEFWYWYLTGLCRVMTYIHSYIRHGLPSLTFFLTLSVSSAMHQSFDGPATNIGVCGFTSRQRFQWPPHNVVTTSFCLLGPCCRGWSGVAHWLVYYKYKLLFIDPLLTQSALEMLFELQSWRICWKIALRVTEVWNTCPNYEVWNTCTHYIFLDHLFWPKICHLVCTEMRWHGMIWAKSV